MINLSYTDEAIQASPLLDETQWLALQQELGVDLLRDCAKELLDEIGQQWVDGVDAVLDLNPDVFCRMAHKSAGASGTMAFARLRHVFLAFEHGGSAMQTAVHLGLLATVFDATSAAIKQMLP